MTPAPLRPLTGHDRLLVVRLGAIGDVIRTLPAVHALRMSCPGLRLSWIVEDAALPLLEGHPDIDEVIRFPRRELVAALRRCWRFPGAVSALARGLRRRDFTVAIDFQGSLKSALLAWLSGAPYRVGFAAGHARELSWFLANAHVRPRAARENRVTRNLAVAAALGASDLGLAVPLLEAPADGRRAEAILSGLTPHGEPLVILSPGTSRLQKHKRWPVERFAGLAEILRRSGAIVAVAWGPGEEGIARRLAAEARGAAVVLPACGLTVLAALLRRAAVFVGADTGPMHLAWAVGCPVVAIFGPTDPRLNAPPVPGHIVLRAGRSTGAVTASMAAEAAHRLLAAGRGGAGAAAPPSRAAGPVGR